uniref:Netrin-1 n=1 Tax=Anabas testudineus TaxID=64144 RepID=A0AAQ6IEN5_ANATE
MSNFSLYQRWSIKHLGRPVHFCQRDALTVLEAAFYFNKEFSSVIPGRTLDSRIICTLCAALRSLVARDMLSRCVDHACSPPIGNLASGRTLHTLSGCWGNSSHHHSPSPHSPVTPHLCPKDTHPPAHMTDDPFLHPDTWWESGAGTALQPEHDEIRLDLETKFCLSYVVVVFRSPRPAAMAIERSLDFGKTWQPLKLFAHNCSAEFGLSDDFSQPGSLCTSRYTSATPCRGGEVILRTLDPSTAKTLDPYSPGALTHLTLTNLRIRLLKAQTCKASVNPLGTRHTDGTLLARGTCLCHGHAEHCVHRCVFQVSGRCLCTHHTAGHHCEKCAPLYNERPWRPANGSSGAPNPCQKCECHGHADSCHFSQRAWLSSGGVSGGVCDDCRHNTVGRRCQRCRHGYHRHPSLPLNSPYACTRCWCDPQGSLPPRPGEEGPWCHSRSGQCHCKSGVGGTSCSHCLAGYWGFGEEGCKACACPRSCDPTNGHCLDRAGYLHSALHKDQSISQCVCKGKCSCKEKRLRSVSDLCKTKYDYGKKLVLSAHDKGSHAEVQVKVCKVFRSGQVALYLGNNKIYPLSWTSRGCTCPVLNPGKIELNVNKRLWSRTNTLLVNRSDDCCS